MSRSKGIFVGALALVAAIGLWRLLAPLGGSISSGGSPHCNITFKRIVELTGDRINAGIVRMSDSEIFLGQRSEVLVFDMDGRFLRAIGREGEGPGEFRRIQEFLVLPDDRLAIIESNPPRLTLMGIDGTYVSAATIPVAIEREGAVYLADGSFILPGRMSDREVFGRPLVRIDSAGKVINYFGDNEVETEEPMLGRMMPRRVAYHPQIGIVSVKRFKYTIERWNLSGDLVERFSGPVDWFQWPAPRDANTDPHVLTVPENQFLGVQIDSVGRIWIVAQVTPPTWQEGVSGGRILDIEKWTDTRIEVIDINTGAAICWTQFHPYVLTAFVAPDRMATYREGPTGEPVITIWEMSLEER